MELIIKNDIGKEKMEDLLFFLKSRNIEVEIKPVAAKEKRIAEFKQALKETKEMAENIASGKDEYETMDGFLKRFRVINKSHALSDEELAEKLSGEISDMPSCSDGDCCEIVTNYCPVFKNGLEKWL
jgi:hypothetical protein